MEIENPGNLGAIARAMGNFNCKDLILINPKCDPLDEIAKCRAKHAQEILKNATVTDKSILKTFDYLISTTAKLGTDYNIPRSPVLPEQLPTLIKAEANIGILIGREGPGLTNEEIKLCDFTVTIPTSTSYPTLNISHAVTIILYELRKILNKEINTDHFIPARKIEKDHLYEQLNKLIEELDFESEEKRETQRLVWRRLIGKAFVTKREAFALFGLLKKIRDKLK